MSQLDLPSKNDNRNYNYSGFQDYDRYEYTAIINLIGSGSRVIDLGCGNGALMERLVQEKQCIAEGIEISESGVEICLNKKLTVHRGRIDEPLSYAEKLFDYAVCNVTLHMVMYPELLLREMKRIARFQIISFPNYGFYKNRLDVLFHGRVPKPSMFGYKWYSTGHIHPLSMKDFGELVSDVGGLEIAGIHLEKSSMFIKNILMQRFPNLFQVLPIYLLRSL